jgi:hypothetical protein
VNVSTYQDRFIKEYKQLSTRIKKLKAMLYKYQNDMLDFTPNCSYELLSRQLTAMLDYKDVLIERAHIEHIPVD